MKIQIEAVLSNTDKVLVVVVALIISCTILADQYGRIILGWFVDAG